MRFAIDMRPSQDGIGGIPEYTSMVAYHCARLASNHQFLLFYSGTKAVPAPWTKESKNVQVYIHRVPNKITNSRLYFYRRPFFDQIIKKVHPQSIDAWFFPNLNFVSLSPSQRSVITVHDVSFQRYPEFFSSKQRWWHRAVHPARLLSNVTKVIAVSQHTKTDIVKEFRIPESKIAVTHLGIDPVFNASAPGSNRGIQKTGRSILTYAGGDPRKNLDVIVRAYGFLRDTNLHTSDVSLHIVGKRGAWTHTALKQIPTDYHGDVHFHHGITREGTGTLMRNASVFVYPSFYEGFGLPLLEAMAAGIPSIASPNSAILETAADSSYYTDPYNPHAMMRAMDAVLSNNSLRMQMIAKGKKRIEGYSWENTARKTLTILEAAATMTLYV